MTRSLFYAPLISAMVRPGCAGSAKGGKLWRTLEGAQLDVVTVLPDFGESWVSQGSLRPSFHEQGF